MFLKKTDGPRIVMLPGGAVLSMADLPPRATRWVASRKAAVVCAVRHGLLTRAEALRRYDLTDEELDLWGTNYDMAGVQGLKVAAIPHIRQL